MADPYVYPKSGVMINKLNIHDDNLLQQQEAHLTTKRLVSIDTAVPIGKLNFDHIKNIHKHIFQDVYQWSGQPRIMDIIKNEPILQGKSVDYSYHKNIEKDFNHIVERMDKIKWQEYSVNDLSAIFAKNVADLWQVHPFREGNTRSTITFASHYAEQHGFPLQRELFKIHSHYTRQSLVLASIGQYSEIEHLQKIIKDSIINGSMKYALKNIVEIYTPTYPCISLLSDKSLMTIKLLNEQHKKQLDTKEIKQIHKTLGDNSVTSPSPSTMDEFMKVDDLIQDMKKAQITYKNNELKSSIDPSVSKIPNFEL